MNVTQSSPTIDGAFDAFLFAPVGDETNGMALSVLSALARLDIDPWADAARLSRLPKASAIASLGQSIARLPPGAWQAADATAIATRLVELLPKQSVKPQSTPAGSPKPTPWRRTATLVMAGLSLGLGAYLLLSQVGGIEHRSVDHGVAGTSVQTERPHSP